MKLSLSFACWLTLGLAITSCSHLFLQPDHVNYFPDAASKIVLQEGFIPTPDGEKLNYWFLPAQIDHKTLPEAKGLIVVLHGNAQNLTSHIQGSSWLTAAGYNLVIFDYRGYGKSTGDRDLAGAFSDVSTALDYITQNLNPQHLPVIFYGQSLGGTLLLKTLSTQPGHWHPKLVVIEGSFYSYQGIAREKLADHWLTWPFQWLAYILLSDRFGLQDKELKTLSPIPVVQFHSQSDPVVPVNQADLIAGGLILPKTIYRYPQPGHVNAMWIDKGHYREILVDLMSRVCLDDD